MNWKLGFLIVLITLSSCAPLHRSQVRLLSNYFNTTAKYPLKIRALNDRVAYYTLESGNVRSALQEGDSSRVSDLVIAVNEYEVMLSFPDSIAKHVQNIEDYIQGYYVLVPNGFNIYKALRSTSVSIVNIFGLGSVASSVIPEANLEIRAPRKEKIKKHLMDNSESFMVSVELVKNFIELFWIPQIKKVDLQLKNDYRTLFDNHHEPLSSLDHYFLYNNHFISQFQKLIATEKFAMQLIVSLQHLVETEEEVRILIKERQKIENNSILLHKLANDLQKMEALVYQSAPKRD